jgi:hypothetical protein
MHNLTATSRELDQLPFGSREVVAVIDLVFSKLNGNYVTLLEILPSLR